MICHVLCSDTAVVHCIKLIRSIHLALLQSLASALAVLFLTRIVEPAHGPRELAKYLAAVIVLSSCLTVAVVTILYYASATSKKSPAKADSAGFMLFKPMGGFEAGLAALLVAVKQLLPDNEVAILGGALSFSAKVCCVQWHSMFALEQHRRSCACLGVYSPSAFRNVQCSLRLGAAPHQLELASSCCLTPPCWLGPAA